MSRYTYSLTSFSPSGSVLQLDNARAAVNNGETSSSESILLASISNVPKLVDASSIQKISIVTSSIAMVYSGLGCDARLLIQAARKVAMKYILKFQETIPITVLVQNLSKVVQDYTHSAGVRPMGASIIIAGYVGKKAIIYQMDPSGTYYAWNATAIGKSSTSVKELFSKRWDPTHTEDVAKHLMLQTLKDTASAGLHDAKVTLYRITPDGVELVSDERL